MTTRCFVPVLGKRIRVTGLDVCGLTPAGGTVDSQLTTDGFITITLSSEVEDGAEIISRKASGALCVNEKNADSFKRFTVEIEFCGVNPSLLGFTTNAVPYADYNGDVAGFTVAEGVIEKKFALELWTGLSGQACAPGAEEASGYLVLPFVQAGVLGDIAIDGENAVTFSMTGAYTKGGNAWGVGPYNVVFDGSTPPAAGPLPEPLDPLDHLLLMDTGVAPPPDACDPGPMPSVAITGVTAGIPGTFGPGNATVPANLAALIADPAIGNSIHTGTVWNTGEYVLLGDLSKAYWDGTGWTIGQAP